MGSPELMTQALARMTELNAHKAALTARIAEIQDVQSKLPPMHQTVLRVIGDVYAPYGDAPQPVDATQVLTVLKEVKAAARSLGVELPELAMSDTLRVIRVCLMPGFDLANFDGCVNQAQYAEVIANAEAAEQAAADAAQASVGNAATS